MSCNKDDDNNPINGSIEGVWSLRYVKSEIDMGFMSGVGVGKDYNATLTFLDEPNQVFGSGTVGLEITTYIGGEVIATEEEIISFENQFETGQWELSGNTLTLAGQSSGSSVTLIVTKLTSNTLNLKYSPDPTTVVIYEFSK